MNRNETKNVFAPITNALVNVLRILFPLEIKQTITVPSHYLGGKLCPGVGKQGKLKSTNAVPAGQTVECPNCHISLIP